jgi:hypothetical protein
MLRVFCREPRRAIRTIRTKSPLAENAENVLHASVNSPKSIPRWRAYHVLFAALQEAHKPRWAFKTLVDVLNKDAQIEGDFDCKFSVRNMQDWQAKPGIQNPRSERFAYVHRWLTKKIGEADFDTAAREKLSVYLAAIAPAEARIVSNDSDTTGASLPQDDGVTEMLAELKVLIGSAKSAEEIRHVTLSYAPIERKKMQFWQVLDRMALELKLGDYQRDIIHAGMPPKIPIEGDDTTRTIAEKIICRTIQLTTAQANVWRLAEGAYPPFVRFGSFPGLKPIARWLAKYWNAGVLKESEAKCRKEGWKWDLSKVASACSAREAEVLVLSWFELSLATQIEGGNDKGKTYLFGLGKWFERTRRKLPP